MSPRDGSTPLAPSSELRAGRALGEWILEEELGRGAMGRVWRARHKALPGRQAALKVPNDADLARRLAREGRLLERIESPHVVGLVGLDPEHEPPYLVMELVEGVSLRQALDARSRLEPGEARRILSEIARGLAAAHAQGVVHRDLKPENVLLARGEGEPGLGTVRVADFGLGTLAAEAAGELLASGSLQSREQSVVGTLRYMAPEARVPGAAVDARADLYALGVILFEVLTGEAPCGAEVPSEVRPELDPRWDPLYRALCARLPQRLASAEEALARLAAVGDRPCAPDALEAALNRCVRPSAGPFARALAFGIDLLPFVLLALGTLRYARGFPALLAFVAYDIAASVVAGRTVGKHLCGIELTDAQGRPPSAAQAFQRSCLRLISLASLGLAYLPTLAGLRAFHDACADTRVLERERGA